jgi:hypothetical protein
VPGRYRSYGREDDQMQEDLETGFSGFNNRVRPDQLQPGVLAESKNGRLDLNGEWQVRRGINILNAPFATGANTFRLPNASEFLANNPNSTVGILPRVMQGVSIATDGIVTVTLDNHGFSVGDEVVINGVFRSSLPDINGSHTITFASGDNRFKFDSGIAGSTGAYTYPPAQGLITSFTLPADPINETLSTQPLSTPAGRSILDVSQVVGLRSGTDYSDPNAFNNGEYIIISTNLSALVLNLSTQETFEMRFPEGESVLELSDMLQAFNRLFIFRDSQIALENKKFFNPIRIKSISQTGTDEVDVETFLLHGLNAGDMIEIRDVAEGTINPNGQFEVTSTTDKTFTYNVGTIGTEDYTVTSDSKIFPTFTLVANGTYRQPSEITFDTFNITNGEAVGTVPAADITNLKVGNTITIENAGNSSLELGDEFIISFVDETTNTIRFYVQEEDTVTSRTGIIFSKPVSIGLGFMHMPAPEFGVYHQRRLVTPFRSTQETINIDTPTESTKITSTGTRDEIAVSDILDSDTYDQVFANFRFNAGTADFTVGLHSFSDDKLLVFNRNSIHLAANSGDLRTAQTQLLTNEVGCVARDSIIQVGNNVLFLSDNGVYGANFQDLYNLRGNEVPLSEPINNTIKSINKDLWHNSSGVYFDNRYYLAVPLNEETFTRAGKARGVVTTGTKTARFNNRILVYNFLNKKWESIDSVGDSEFEFKKLIVAGDGEERGVYSLSTNGGIHRLDILDQGNDRIITEVATGSEDLVTTPEIEGSMTTRMFTNKTIDRKKWNNFEMQVQSSLDLKSDFYITGITENVDDTIDLKQLSSYLNNQLLSEDEDVSIRGRIGNRRAYGFQFKIDRTTGRPRVRSLKVAAAEAFRSIREAI